MRKKAESQYLPLTSACGMPQSMCQFPFEFVCNTASHLLEQMDKHKNEIKLKLKNNAN